MSNEMINTTVLLPPMIEHTFNKNLLFTYLQRINERVESKIIPLSSIKIRDIDTGKRRDFDKLMKDFRETYERKKIEEENYQAKVKESIQKRPRIPTSGGFMRFKRMESRE